jgi:nicotinic acid mononucleotide adenylyltransferase
MSSADAFRDNNNNNNDDYYSLDHLHRRMQAFLQAKSTDVQFAVAIAGGGSHFLSTLASTPGASAVLLEGVVAYDRESFHDYLYSNRQGDALEKQLLELSVQGETIITEPATDDIISRPKTWRYASKEASLLLGSAAMHRGLYLTTRSMSDSSSSEGAMSRMKQTVGVALTSKLSTRSSSRPERRSQAFCIVTRSDGPPVTLEAILAANRSRLEEDIVVSHLLLTCLEFALNTSSTTTSTSSATNKTGDSLFLSAPPKKEPQRALMEAIDRLLLHHEPCVMLLGSNNNSTDDDEALFLQPLAVPVLPANSLILSGSFNPPHQGHMALAKAALDASGCSVVWFELALTNADKQSNWTVESVLERLEGFRSLTSNESTIGLGAWGVLLTDKVPLFIDKVRLLEPLQAKSRTTTMAAVNDDAQQLHFVIGTDTLVRMVDPKYYDNSSDKMMNALLKMPCRFVVGGRLEQSKIKDGSATFVTGKETVDALPKELQAKFILLPDFRVDISSTELRKKKTEG